MNELKKRYYFIDESIFDFNETKYFALVCVTLNKTSCQSMADALSQVKAKLKSDQFLGIRKSAKLLHYTDDNLTIRQEVIELLRFEEFNAYIAFIKYNQSKYEENYLLLLRKILKDRILSDKKSLIYINYEQNRQISKEKFIYTVEHIIDNVKKTEATIIMPEIKVISKEEILVTVPDYILGLFGTYCKKDVPGFQLLQFEKIRSKIRLIIDTDKDIFYDRKHIFDIKSQ